MLYAGDCGIVSRSATSLKKIMAMVKASDGSDRVEDENGDHATRCCEQDPLDRGHRPELHAVDTICLPRGTNHCGRRHRSQPLHKRRLGCIPQERPSAVLQADCCSPARARSTIVPNRGLRSLAIWVRGVVPPPERVRRIEETALLPKTSKKLVTAFISRCSTEHRT